MREKEGMRLKVTKRILLIDDEAYDNKCKKIVQYMEEKGIFYDIAVTLEEATEKVLSDLYDGIILDRYFPIKEGEENKGAGKMFLEILEERGKQIPVVVYSTMGRIGIENRLVLDYTSPGDSGQLDKVKKLLDYTPENNRYSNLDDKEK